eukprot:TRINITY_DN11184_c0_g1_i4.p1 TRINITY_DN11184_c0_g1~~TRINITY_DN11184_c0_g1_i4.p1  ORF type:complete len:114 (-),score=22.21 TRINITY_DN11184_c0_g1_i4:224-565(-)
MFLSAKAESFALINHLNFLSGRPKFTSGVHKKPFALFITRKSQGSSGINAEYGSIEIFSYMELQRTANGYVLLMENNENRFNPNFVSNMTSLLDDVEKSDAQFLLITGDGKLV